jgi:nucleoside-diphosphate-sugar epimerase
VERLVTEGARVHALGRRSHLTVLSHHLITHANLIWHSVDLRDADATRACVLEVSPKYVFHLAVLVDASRSLVNSDELIRNNVGGTINLLTAATEVSALKAFVNTGTCEEYGHNSPPFCETQLPDPISPYAASKSAAWLCCRMFYNMAGLPVVTLRPFTTYGPRQPEYMLVSHVIRSALDGKDVPISPGEQTRECNFVGDIVESYLLAATTPEVTGQTLNIGTGIEVTVRSLAERILELMGNPVRLLVGQLPYRADEIKRLYSDSRKARLLLGWEPQVELDDGLRRTIKWYRENYSAELSKPRE